MQKVMKAEQLRRESGLISWIMTQFLSPFFLSAFFFSLIKCLKINTKRLFAQRESVCLPAATAGCWASSPPRTDPSSCAPQTQEMLTPAFGQLQGRSACRGFVGAQHNAAKRIRSGETPLTFPFPQEDALPAAAGCAMVVRLGVVTRCCLTE